MKVIQSTLGLGTSSIMGSGSEEHRQRLLGAAFDAGITHFDTARYYGLGCAEAVVGRFAKGKRDKMTITTKLGIVPESLVEAGASRVALKTIGKLPGIGGVVKSVTKRRQSQRFNRFSVSDINKSLEKSLVALNTDYVDVLLTHAPRPSDLNDEVVAELLKFVKQGKTRSIGIGGMDFGELKQIIARFPDLKQVCQFEHSVLFSNASNFEEPSATKIVFASLARSYFAILKAIDEDATLTGRLQSAVSGKPINKESLASLLLQFAHETPGVDCVLLSTRKVENIQKNIAAIHEPKFTAGEIAAFVSVLQSSSIHPAESSGS